MRPPIGMVHDEGPGAAELVPDREGRADRAAGIARGRLHIDPPERRHPPHLAVGDRIHGAAAGEREIGQAVALLQRADQDERRPPRTSPGPSARCRDADPQRIVGHAARPEQLLERGRKQVVKFGRAVCPLVRHLLLVMAKIGEIERIAPVGLKPHDLAHGIHERGLP